LRGLVAQILGKIAQAFAGGESATQLVDLFDRPVA